MPDRNTSRALPKALTNKGIDDMSLFHLGFRDGSIVGTSHFDQPGCAHYWNSVFCQVAKDLLLLTKDGHLRQSRGEKRASEGS